MDVVELHASRFTVLHVNHIAVSGESVAGEDDFATLLGSGVGIMPVGERIGEKLPVPAVKTQLAVALQDRRPGMADERHDRAQRDVALFALTAASRESQRLVFILRDLPESHGALRVVLRRNLPTNPASGRLAGVNVTDLAAFRHLPPETFPVIDMQKSIFDKPLGTIAHGHLEKQGGLRRGVVLRFDQHIRPAAPSRIISHRHQPPLARFANRIENRLHLGGMGRVEEEHHLVEAGQTLGIVGLADGPSEGVPQIDLARLGTPGPEIKHVGVEIRIGRRRHEVLLAAVDPQSGIEPRRYVRFVFSVLFLGDQAFLRSFFLPRKGIVADLDRRENGCRRQQSHREQRDDSFHTGMILREI